MAGGGVPRLLAYDTIRPIRFLQGHVREKLHPAQFVPRLFREKLRPARGLHRLFREKVRPARHKTPILGHFSCAGRTISRSRPPLDRAGRTFSRTGCCDVATLKPMTPLQPKNAPKSPISHPQRRRRFQPARLTGPQRRHSFQTTTHLVCAHRLRHQQASMRPLPTKTRMQFDWAKSQ